MPVAKKVVKKIAKKAVKKVAKKKSNITVLAPDVLPDFSIQLTGQITIILGLKGYNPMLIRYNSTDDANNFLKLILAAENQIGSVTSYTKLEEVICKELLLV